MKRVDFKKGFGIFLLVILGLTLFTGCSNDNNNLESNKTDTKNTLEKVIIAESARGMSWLPTYIAKTEGFFVEEGLDVEFITYNGGTVAIPALISGDAQFCQTGYDQVLKTYEAGQPTTIIAATTETHPWMLFGAKGITSVTDLKGKIVSAGLPGSSNRAFVMACLKAGGLDPEKDVTYVQITGGGNVASLDSGQTFACMGSQNAEGVYLKENNYPLLMDLSNPEIHQKVIGASKFHLHMIHVTNKYLEEHPESVQAFLNAIVKAIGWINTHSPEEIYESVEIYFPSDEKETGVKIVEMNLEILSSDCYISQEGHDAVVDWSINLVQYIKNYIPIEDIYDSSYLEKAWQNVSK